MSALVKYPTLQKLADDLARLDATEHVREALRAGRAVRFGRGRDVAPVYVPWLGREWMLSAGQRAAVKMMVEALGNASADVPEPMLVEAAGRRGKLRDVFAGTDAWGTLVVPGERAGSYRINAPPGMLPPDAETDEGGAGDGE